VRKAEGKRLHARPRRRWDDYVKVDILEMEEHVVNCIYLVKD
jgi:hypothetical protein